MERRPSPIPWYKTHLPVPRSQEIDIDAVAASVQAASASSLNEVRSMHDEKIVERVMSFLPQAQGMNPAELLMLAKNQGGGFGEGGQGMFFLLFLLLLLGRNGGGLFGQGDAAAAGLTVADLQNINTQISALQTNQNAGFSNLVDRICGVNSAITDSKSSILTQLCNLGTQMQQCCCEIERSIERSTASIKEFTGAGFNALQAQATQNQFTNITEFNSIKTQMAADKCEITTRIAASEAAIIGRLNQDKMDALMAENAALKLGASQLAQTQTLKDYIDAACKK